ncbi:MAG: hypothetical protein JSV18_08410 [Candidatus Bathyarchaeota archaeon]|nr:MAG: hypothetical protein JSV18_08410 [Candidatus Bathyarchaeota archaeon]
MTRRGVVHTLDSFFAAIIIVTALLYASQIPRERDYLEDENLDALGMQTLVRLDGDGVLGRLVDDNDWDGLERAIRVALPTWVSFNATVFDEQGAIINNHSISNGGLLGRRVESLEYPISVESGSCPIYRLRLQIGG